MTSVDPLIKEQYVRNTKLLLVYAKSGNIEKIQELIPVSNVNIHNGEALNIALKHKHTEVIALLLQHTALSSSLVQAALVEHKGRYFIDFFETWTAGRHRPFSQLDELFIGSLFRTAALHDRCPILTYLLEQENTLQYTFNTVPALQTALRAGHENATKLLLSSVDVKEHCVDLTQYVLESNSLKAWDIFSEHLKTIQFYEPIIKTVILPIVENFVQRQTWGPSFFSLHVLEKIQNDLVICKRNELLNIVQEHTLQHDVQHVDKKRKI